MAITEPGLYDLPAAEYHADPVPEGSLSQSRAKVLLDEGGPAKFKAAESEPRVEKREFDLGTTVHALVLGKGEERIVVIDAPDRRKQATKDAIEAAYAEGKTPVLTKEMDRARRVAASLPAWVRDLFTGGQPEVSMFWQHASGLWLRGQMDYYHPAERIVDLKTMRDTSERGFRRAVWDHRYYMQAAWYRRGVEHLTGELLPYLIVGVETEPPYLVRVKRISEDYLAVGEAHMDEAISTYLHCTETGQWPGHPEGIETLTPPPWAADDLAEDTIAALEQLIEGDTAA